MVAYVPKPGDLLLGAEASRRADARSIERLGTTGRALMETAGEAAASFLIRRMATVGQPAALILCGKGNNGGDGLVVARHLLDTGWDVAVALAYPASEFSPDAAENYRRLPDSERLTVLAPSADLRPWIDAHKADITSGGSEAPASLLPIDFSRSTSFATSGFEREESGTADVFARGPVVVDALLGTGFRGTMRPELASLLAAGSGCPVLALDLPSGLDADTGAAAPEILPADATIAFGTLKRGMFYGDGPARCGEIQLVPLGFPDDILLETAREFPAAASDPSLRSEQDAAISQAPHGSNSTAPHPDEYVLRADRLSVSPPRRNHKYDQPAVMVVGGAPGMVGAPVMAAKAAWSLGLGSVRVAFPAAHMQAMHALLPQLANLPLGSVTDGHFTPSMADPLMEQLLQRDHVLLIGPGMGRDPETLTFVIRLLSAWHGPTVVDADALYALAESGADLPSRNEPLILTPHIGELKRFAEHTYDRSGTINRLSRVYGATVLSKGHPSIIHTTDGRRFMTGYDTRVFSRAGYGDVLAGLTAGFLSMGGEPHACCAAALLESKRRFDHRSTQNRNVEPWLLADPAC